MENNDNKQIKYKGKLDLGGTEIDCYVTKDGTRCFNEEGFKKALNFVFGSLEQEVKCHFCGEELPKIVEILKEIGLKNPKKFMELYNNESKFICDNCEDNNLIYDN